MTCRLPSVLVVAAAFCIVGLDRSAATGPDDAGADRNVRSAAADWPSWRGPHANNHASGQAAPLRWDSSQGIVWKMSLPGQGHASPCVEGDKIFVATADEEAGTQLLLAFDRQNGTQLWRTVVHREALPTINPKNSHASATPATDGERVYVVFAQANRLSVTAIDIAGRIVWQQQAGTYRHANGLGASPVLYGGLVIVASDNPADPALVALRCSDGQVQWRTRRRASDNSATPIVGRVAGRPQLLLNGAYTVNSYDPASGEPLWHVEHKTEVAACTMAFDDERVYASGNVPEPRLLSVRADGDGDVTGTHVVWKTHQSVTYVPSPLVVGRHLFLVTDSGIAFCREASTGKIVWKHRLGGNFSASPVLASDRVYATSEAGVTHVFRATTEFSPLAENDLATRCLATPAICGDRIYVRSATHLYAICGLPSR